MDLFVSFVLLFCVINDLLNFLLYQRLKERIIDLESEVKILRKITIFDFIQEYIEQIGATEDGEIQK